MPHLRFRAVEKNHVQELSQNLAEILAILIETTADNFTFEHVPTTFFRSGAEEKSYPFVEVLWFERPAPVKKKVAEHLTLKIKQLTGAVDVVVVFTTLDKTSYFENGTHF